jgi:hypothetical protein
VPFQIQKSAHIYIARRRYCKLGKFVSGIVLDGWSVVNLLWNSGQTSPPRHAVVHLLQAPGILLYVSHS